MGHDLQDGGVSAGLPAAAAAIVRRYRDDAAPPPAVWSEVIARQLDHRSVRGYLPDPLPPGTLEVLVAAAQSAATSSNLQLWSVVAVEDAERRARLAAWAGNQKHVVTAPLLLVFLADFSRAVRIAAARGEEARTIAYVESLIVATADAALAAQNAALAAESLGLGTVYLGAIRNHVDEVARELALPAHVYPVFGLVVGRPDPSLASAVKPRLPQSVVLHRERYGAEGESAAVAAYDERLKDFQREQGLRPAAWSEVATERVARIARLNGRERLGALLRTIGFGLE